MKNSDIRNLGVAELNEAILEQEEGLRKLKFAHAITPIENPMRLREAKKTIARLKTALSLKSKEAQA